MTFLEVLQWVQASLYALVALASLRAWWRQRTATAAYVALAFTALALTTGTSRIEELTGTTRPELVGDLMTAGLVCFPWLLAAFAWSFTGRLPTWLRVAGVVTLVLALAIIPLPPLGGAGERTATGHAYVAIVLVQWSALSLLAAIHLWRAGRGQPVVRARTRLLASGALVLAATLLLAGNVTSEEGDTLSIVIALLVILAAVLFAAGFAPPTPLRLYWRQVPSQRMHEMQTALVAAVTPDQAAAAVVPVLADTFGGGALCLDPAGRIVAREGLDDATAAEIATRLQAGDTAIPGVQVQPTDGWSLAVQTSPYAPLFGEDEHALLERFGMQLRLALQRSELYVAHGQARAELEEASKDLQAMLVGLAHDLRSPAVTISTYAALLPDAEDDADRDQMLEGLRDGSAYLDRLVDGLLSLSRIGRNDGEPEPVDLEEVVGGVSRRLRASYPELRVTTDGRLPTVCIDRLRIEQVVDNLLGNAAKHGDRDDLSVAVSWAPSPDDGGVLTVADDGRGVPDAEREAVFALFRRGSTSAAGSGVGLGLVRRVIENHGGRIRFAPSERGARIEIELPGDVLVDDGVDRRTRPATPGSDTAPASGTAPTSDAGSDVGRRRR